MTVGLFDVLISMFVIIGFGLVMYSGFRKQSVKDTINDIIEALDGLDDRANETAGDILGGIKRE